jgi:phosphatidylinositol glycan class V
MVEVGSARRSVSATDGVDRQHVRLVVLAALTSRVLVWLLGVLAHSAAGTYDISHQAHDTRIHPAPATALDRAIRATIEPFVYWDGQHFMTIATAGYEYEKEHAFFPFVPLMARASGALIELMVPSSIISSYDAMLIGVFIITNLTFIAAAAAFLYLSAHVLQDRTLALRSALLFCITPASIFMSAVYTESYFALFSFCGLYCLVRRRYWTAALWFFGTCAVRSNGSLYVAYFIWDAFHTLIDVNISLPKVFFVVLVFMSFEEFNIDRHLVDGREYCLFSNWRRVRSLPSFPFWPFSTTATCDTVSNEQCRSHIAQIYCRTFIRMFKRATGMSASWRTTK